MSTFTDLSHILHRWTRWIRLRLALTWGLRGLAIGLLLALIVGTVGLLGARLLRDEFLALVGILAFSVSLLAGTLAFFWPLPPGKAARVFDRVFRLKERVSTALELREATPTPLIEQQLEDTLAAAKRVQPRRDLPLRLKTLESALALVFALMIGLLLWRGETWFLAAEHNRAVQQAVDEQARQIEEILSQIEGDESLTDEQKRALSKPLREALEGLQADPSQESAVSILASAGEKLQALSDPQAKQMAESLQRAGEQLASQEGSPLEAVGRELAQGNAVNAAAQLSQMDVSRLSAAEREQLASQLEQMSETLASSNPQLASQLNQAAQALQNDDLAAAQQALQDAAQTLARAGQQLTYSQTAGQLAQQMGQGAGQVLAAGGGQSPSQTGSGVAQDGQSGGGSGQGSGMSDSSSGNEAGNSPIPQDNGSGDGGQSAYEQIYAPSLLGGEGGATVNLPNSGADGTTVGTGPSSPSDAGQLTVPYNEAYAEYNEIIQQAIESGTVPLEFIQLILDYFNSIAP
jgi:hypothetical protein